MEFPLVPAGSLNVSLRERTDRVPQPAQQSSPPSWAAPNSAILLRTYNPATNTFFIDPHYVQDFEAIEQPGKPSQWSNLVSQTAKHFYQKTAASQQKKKHTVDLYV
jgi:hypothetical protein